MVARFWKKLLALAALLVIAGTGTLCSAQTAQAAGRESFAGKLTNTDIEATTLIVVVSIPAEALEALPLEGTKYLPPESKPGLSTRDASSQPITAQQSQESVDSAQLQALPLPGRDWRSFTLETPASTGTVDEERRAPATAGREPDVTVDGAHVQPAFGSAGGGRSSARGSALISPAFGELAVRELQSVNGSGVVTVYSGRTRWVRGIPSHNG